MSMAERSWQDKVENYVDSYTKTVNAGTAENIIAIDTKSPLVIYSITIAHSQANASGELALIDGSASGDSGDTRKMRMRIASAATTDRQGPFHMSFPRGVYFDTGLIVSAATLTADVTITYKQRY